MKPLNPQPPFVWPEPRELERICSYQHQPPFGELALKSRSLFGIITALTSRGINTLQFWLEQNPALLANLIVIVYPACATKHADLSRLIDLVEQTSPRLSVNIRPLESVTDRASSALCFLTPESEGVWLTIGSSEDLGMEPRRDGHVNFVFRGDPALVESFKRYFDWQWVNSREITADGAAQVPDLVLPEGTQEGAGMWRAYMSGFVDADTPQLVAHVNHESGDVTIQTKDGDEVKPPTEELGLPKLDKMAERIARLYEKGALVSIEKLTRIQPLDAPLDPKLFGDQSELQKGNVTRKVSMRVSIVDEKALKKIEKCRQGLRVLLTKLTFSLADNMHWMPDTARELFESELKRINAEGQKLISDLLKGDVDAFINARREALVSDINAMYEALDKKEQVTADVIELVIKSLKERLSKAQLGNFLPKLSYSLVSFSSRDNTLVSPWGQAFTLLSDMATFPRKALTEKFFFNGTEVSEDDLMDAMNVADDALLRDLRVRGMKDRCRRELEVLHRIKKASIESRDRCELVLRVIDGNGVKEIDEIIEQKESEARAIETQSAPPKGHALSTGS